ncbi:MAG: glycoside hydrolase family 2 sugar binding [Verrucomicrobiaceae bacterium]|nr:glycoside hydrolase family 2 sugar binding [Verrucomicrobiaceae bacterium]
MRTRLFLPRPEYPRPDRQRSFVHGVDWLNLNGPWEFRFDPDRLGVGQEWFAPDETRWTEQIIVPFCWESLAAWGEGDAAGNDHFFSWRAYRRPLELDHENYRRAERYEVGWYRRLIVIPRNEHWEGKRVILTIGAADFFTDCWCNGHHAGRREGGFTPLEYDLTDLLEPGRDGALRAQLVIRVEDPADNREQPVGKQWGWYSTASGIWQTVFLEPRSPHFIERFQVTSDLVAGAATLTVFTQGGGELAVKVITPTGEEMEERFAVQHGVARATMPLNPVILWDPNDPQLYRLQLTLLERGHRDVVHGYFGMRSLSARPVAEADAPAALCFNDQPIYIRGALYQSYYPEGIYTAGDVQVLIDDINFAKRAGFDMLRVHIKIDDPLLLYYADTLGILLMCDFPNFGEGGDTPLGRRRFEEMMRAAIARDFNHPSIIAWCIFNETWGFGGQVEIVKLINPRQPALGRETAPRAPGTKLANRDAYHWVEAMWNLAKSLDPTRLVEDMSVVAWDHLEHYGHGGTDINSWHFYSHNYEEARAHIREVVENTYAGSTFNYVPGFTQNNQPLITSEYGGIGALDGDRDVSWSFKFLTNELRLHGKLSAYIFTELHDVEWERNGFLNYDRTPKEFGYDPRIINNGDTLPIDAPPILRCQPGEERVVEIFSSHFARRPKKNISLHWRMSGIDSLGWMNEELVSGVKAIPFTQYRVELAERLVLRLPEATMLCTLWVLAIAEDGLVVARNFVQFFVDGGFPPHIEASPQKIFRAQLHETSAAEWSGKSSNPEDALATGSIYGQGHGRFEWRFPLTDSGLGEVKKIRVLCEASGRREGCQQTDSFSQPTMLRLLLNGVRIHEGLLPNHPHDTRGALSYLRGGCGAYGYLVSATVEGELMHELVSAGDVDALILQCEVPAGNFTGGLTIYGGDCGRFPVSPTIIIETA